MVKLISKKYNESGFVKTILLFLMVFTFSKNWAQTTDLIFSEYVEGSSNNKYIEIYNGTGATVNLTDYRLRLYANGATSPTNDVILSGSLATCSVVVYRNTSAGLTLPTGVTSSVNAAINFNGDDAVVLFKISTNSIVDIIGNIGCDPGIAWTSAPNSTLDKTLVRKASICTGIQVDNATNCPFPTLGTEWDVYNIDDVSDLGSHTNNCGGCGTVTPTYTVTFNANTGTGSMAAQTASTITNLMSNTFTKAGCTFTGWNTAANGSGTAYADGQAYGFTADLTLYAQWSCSAVSHTVTFNANTGTGSMSAQTASTTTNLTSNAFTKASCSFAGWNTAANGSGTAYTDGQAYSFAADLTLYAQWSCGSTCPYLVSAVINSCDGCADEGNNEFLVLNTGSYSFQVNPSNVKITYSNGPVNLTSGFAAQPTSLATLNTPTINAGGTTFVDVSSGAATVPANSTLLVINKGACFTGDWSAYCGLGTVYVAFSSVSAWSTTGWFGNNTTPRNFVTDFSAVNSACGTTTYAYNQVGIAGTPFDFGSGGDGASVSFNGSSPPTYISGNGNCAPPNIILPIHLLDFYGTKNGSVNELVWKVAEEENILNYTVEKSNDAVNFTELGTIYLSQANKTEESVKTYELKDFSPFKEITYYRLSSREYDGARIYYNIISIDDNSKAWAYSHYQQGTELVVAFKSSIPKNSTIELFDLSGKELVNRAIDQSHIKINVGEFTMGIYFVRISTPYKTENFKIVIQK